MDGGGRETDRGRRRAGGKPENILVCIWSGMPFKSCQWRCCFDLILIYKDHLATGGHWAEVFKILMVLTVPMVTQMLNRSGFEWCKRDSVKESG